MRTQLFVLAIATTFYCFAQVSPPAMAQTGSTGGTVGKHDKSVSGGEESAKPKSKSSGCGNVAGTYKYPLGRIAVFKANGSTTISPIEAQGRWTCAGGQVTIVWNSGFIDHLTPKPGGFSGVNNANMQFELVRM